MALLTIVFSSLDDLSFRWICFLRLLRTVTDFKSDCDLWCYQVMWAFFPPSCLFIGSSTYIDNCISNTSVSAFLLFQQTSKLMQKCKGKKESSSSQLKIGGDDCPSLLNDRYVGNKVKITKIYIHKIGAKWQLEANFNWLPKDYASLDDSR